MSDFAIERAEQGDVDVLRLAGQLDAHSFPQLQEALEGLGVSNRARVVLDCESLEYISSAGLGVLKKMSREFREKEGDIRLASLTPKIKNVVDLLGFSQVIRVFPGSEEAVRSFTE
ncbi:MAG: STAS domain-containing protein [Planctomycetes bacterium]|nr:STAS domain-containing protein [Planctomycetota bacterium]